MKKMLKSKKGTILTEALISIFIIGTLFVSIAVAVTTSLSNTKLLQETNETSSYAQKIVDGLYAVSETDSEIFFGILEQRYDEYIAQGDYSIPCEIDLMSIAEDIQHMKDNGDTDVISLYDILNYTNDDVNDTTSEKEMREYMVKLYVLPSESPTTTDSVSYFTTYNPYLTDGMNGSRIFNMSEFEDIYTFKLVVSKTVNSIGNGTTNYTTDSPAKVTYIFQIKSNGR